MALATMCRICLRPDPVPRQSLSEGTIVGRPAAEVLSLVGGVPILPEDRYSQVCCADCWQQLEVAYNLRELIQQSYRKLGEMLNGVADKVVVVKQELGEVGEEQASIVGNYEFLDLKSDPCSSTVVKSEPMDSEELPSEEEETPKIKEEVTVEETRVEDPDESSSDGARGNPRSFFEELPVKPTQCCGCRLSCANMEELHAHFKAVHAQNRTPSSEIKKGLQECSQCYKLIRSKNSHRPRSLRCKLCGEMFSKWYGATLHYKNKHRPGKRPEPKICCGCHERFQTTAELKIHANLTHFPNRLPHDEKRPFVCEICYKNYPDHTGLHQHQRRLAKDSKPHQCTQCERSFHFLNALRDHELMHKQEKTLPCPKCPALFITQHSLRKHIARHEMPPTKFQCATCAKCFKSQKSLREHGYVAHTGERPHKCGHCEASFARYDCYRAHVRGMHQEQQQQDQQQQGERDVHECRVCGKTFRLAHYLVRHTREMHERTAKPFPCAHCAEGFVRKQGLMNHMARVHPGVGE
uniref:Zinc finger protein 26 n=1 Tax=Culex pipiens TaxID=7175 RepID=A0A8D8AIL9_CULPI